MKRAGADPGAVQRRRRTPLLVAGVVGIALAAAWVALSPTAPPVTADAPAEPVAPLALKLPPAPVAASVAASARPVLPAAAGSAVGNAAAPRRIGAEGYGPHIERAQAGSDPHAAWQAVLWLRQCASNEGRRHSVETLRNQGVSPEMMTQLMVEADAEARLCQTITAQHRAGLAALASRAMRAGVPEAASAYAAAAFPGDLSASERREVADAMRRDAQSGDAQSLVNAATSHPDWGLTDAERLTFLMAYAGLPEHPQARGIAESLLRQGQLHMSTPPTQAQIAAALQDAKQLLDRRAAPRP